MGDHWFIVQINGVDVVRVLRRGSTAVHFTQEPLKEGAQVEIEVDWGRRFDHMQQHSGTISHDLSSLLQFFTTLQLST